jgi:hypothetical protein
MDHVDDSVGRCQRASGGSTRSSQEPGFLSGLIVGIVWAARGEGYQADLARYFLTDRIVTDQHRVEGRTRRPTTRTQLSSAKPKV